MCGIFGYTGHKNPVKMAINGLKLLEYRGYDSAGIAGMSNDNLLFCKEVGKVSKLEEMVKEKQLHLDISIAHTRWATHGKPTENNAHPHFDMNNTLAIVHNGIIENHVTLRNFLQEEGIKFSSETDTEVIAQLMALLYDGDLLEAVQKTISKLEGSYAIAMIHKNHPDKIVAIAHESPLIIGIGAGEAFVSSDPNACSPHTREVVFLSNSEIAFVSNNKLEIYDSSMMEIQKETMELTHEVEEITKNGFQHYTLKEIYEQPRTIRQALLSRSTEEYGSAIFDELEIPIDDLIEIERIVIVACGTSWHAGLAAAYMLEDLARIPVEVEISSEFRYKNPIVHPRTAVIAISQSGETADTLAAIMELKEKGAKIVSIVNVMGSSMTRESDAVIYLRAGPEVGVASTKAFTSQMVVLSLMTLSLARMRDMSKREGTEFVKAIEKLPEQVQQILDKEKEILAIAKKYAHHDIFFYLGRQYMYPAALEGALKLKEISYINANAYPAGEMKHGPIALINSECPTVALCANEITLHKTLSNLMEIKARNGEVIAIAMENQQEVKSVADDVIWIPNTLDPLAIIPSTVVTQLLAYHIAKERGAEIDQPRNLAKSVTVE